MTTAIEQELVQLRRDRDYLKAQMKLQFFTPTRDKIELANILQRIAVLEAQLRQGQANG